MNPILMAIDDGIAQGESNMADAFFIVAIALAVLSGLAYATGNVGTVSDDPGADDLRPLARLATALLAFAVAAVGLRLVPVSRVDGCLRRPRHVGGDPHRHRRSRPRPLRVPTP